MRDGADSPAALSIVGTGGGIASSVSVTAAEGVADVPPDVEAVAVSLLEPSDRATDAFHQPVAAWACTVVDGMLLLWILTVLPGAATPVISCGVDETAEEAVRITGAGGLNPPGPTAARASISMPEECESDPAEPGAGRASETGLPRVSRIEAPSPGSARAFVPL